MTAGRLPGQLGGSQNGGRWRRLLGLSPVRQRPGDGRGLVCRCHKGNHPEDQMVLWRGPGNPKRRGEAPDAWAKCSHFWELTQKEPRLHPARGELRPGRLGPQHRLCKIHTQCFSTFAVVLRDVTGHRVGSQHGQPGDQSKKQERWGHLLLVCCTWASAQPCVRHHCWSVC